MFEFLTAQPLLLVFILVGLGAGIGHLKIKGIGLGAAAVLFVAIGGSAWATALDVELEVPEIVGTVGLVLFTFTIGVVSGANFFASLKNGWRPILAMVALLFLGAGVAYGGGRVLGLDEATAAGTFAGAVTNTPALAAARAATGSDAPTVGYAVAYIFGVLGMIAFALLALRSAAKDTDAPPALINRTVRVETTSEPSIADLEARFEGRIKFSRVRHGEGTPVLTAAEDDVLRVDDLVTVVGPGDFVDEVTHLLGHVSSHDLGGDRRYLDFRRVTVSNPAIAGRAIGELDLENRLGARVIRVRRGDVDMLASDSLVLQAGDRARVVGPRERMEGVSRYFGDSAKGFSDLNPFALAVGMAIGIGIGVIAIPIPGFRFSLGAAAGTLIVGLIFGRIGRIGPVVTTMPVSSAQALTELGLLLFLAQAGTRAGTQIATAFSSGEWIKIIVLGAAVTCVVGLGLFVVMKHGFGVGGTKLSGMLGGTQTQPAVLAFANGRTNNDARVALGYALVYPAAMIVKILLGQILGTIN
ncbi:MAG: transporter [Bifidobacteriaceae bacterium]|jgi:putative transport protein|nr:transporter [Bifidobacteriaceae bacterium]